MKIMCQCAVDCFALISGYVGLKGKYKYTNICILWLKVLLYTLGLTAVFTILGYENFSLKMWIKSCMPVFTGEYWYFTAYFALFFLMPVLNFASQKMTYKQHLVLINLWLIVFSVMPTMLIKDTFEMSDGYSVWWLMILYMVGTFVSKYEERIDVKRWLWMALYIGSVSLTFLFKVMVEILSISFVPSNLLAGYMSPVMVGAAFGLLMFFKDINISPSMGKIIAALASCTFGVYIIHRNSLFWGMFISGHTAVLAQRNCIVLILTILLRAMLIFLFCGSIDFATNRIIKKLKIKDKFIKIESKYLNPLW